MIAYRIVMSVFFVLGFWYQLAWAVAGFRSRGALVAWTYVVGGLISIALLVWTWLLAC